MINLIGRVSVEKQIVTGNIKLVPSGNELQSKKITPTAAGQVVRPDPGFNGLSDVTVEGDSALEASNIRYGVEIFDVVGTYKGDGANTHDITVAPTGKDFTEYPYSGFDGISSVTVEGDANLVAENIKKDVAIYGVTGTFETPLNPIVITPTGEDIITTPTADTGFSEVTVKGDANLIPENIKSGITIYGVEGISEGGSAIPEPYASYIAEAEAVYGGEYANVIYAEGYGEHTGVVYHTVMFLLDNWTISAYDAATTGYTHSGFMMVQKEDEGEWVLTDYSTASTDKHYAKNIKAASFYVEYEGMTLFPVGLSCYPDTTAINYASWDDGTFTETLETGDVLSYSVTFDADGQPTKITAADGTETAIDWGES